MKNFLVKCLGFALTMIFVLGAVDLFVSYRLKETPGLANGEIEVWHDIYRGKIDADLLIQGSSRARVHINPEKIASALHMSSYNIGMDGQKAPIQQLRLKEFLRLNKEPKIILHSLDIFMFSKTDELYLPEQFYPYLLFNWNTITELLPYKGFSSADFIIPGFRYRGKQTLLDEAFSLKPYSSTRQTKRILGYQPEDQTWSNDFENQKKKAGSIHISVDSGFIKQFEAYIVESLQRDIKIILVYSPEYIEGQSYSTNRAELFQIWEGLSAKYNIPFYNYSGDSISYNQDYFYNVQHLNRIGAEKFTDVLVSDLSKSPLLKL